MNEMNGANGELRVDLVIDGAVARRRAGIGVGQLALALAQLGAEEAVIEELAQLGDMDWPADETGDRIAMSVAAATGQSAAAGPGLTSVPLRESPQQAGTLRRRSGRSRWLAVAAVAAAAVVVAGAVHLIGAPHGAVGHSAGTGLGWQGYRPSAGGRKSGAQTASRCQQPLPEHARGLLELGALHDLVRS